MQKLDDIAKCASRCDQIDKGRLAHAPYQVFGIQADRGEIGA